LTRSSSFTYKSHTIYYIQQSPRQDWLQVRQHPRQLLTTSAPELENTTNPTRQPANQ
jgi:hypothetical protein